MSLVIISSLVVCLHPAKFWNSVTVPFFPLLHLWPQSLLHLPSQICLFATKDVLSFIYTCKFSLFSHTQNASLHTLVNRSRTNLKAVWDVIEGIQDSSSFFTLLPLFSFISASGITKPWVAIPEFVVVKRQTRSHGWPSSAWVCIYSVTKSHGFYPASTSLSLPQLLGFRSLSLLSGWLQHSPNWFPCAPRFLPPIHFSCCRQSDLF